MDSEVPNIVDEHRILLQRLVLHQDRPQGFESLYRKPHVSRIFLIDLLISKFYCKLKGLTWASFFQRGGIITNGNKWLVLQEEKSYSQVLKVGPLFKLERSSRAKAG
jgi:hypothetical protein